MLRIIPFAMTLLPRHLLRLLLLHVAVCNAIAWVDVVRIQANFPKQVSAVDTGDIASRLSALEQTVANRLNSIEAKLMGLSADRSNQSGNLNLRRDTVAAIAQGDFTLAEQKLLQLNDADTVTEIVCDLVASSSHYIRVFLNLSQSVSEASVKSQILKSLYEEVEQNNHTSTLDLIALAKALSKEKQFKDLISFESKLIPRITVGTLSRLLCVLRTQENQNSSKPEWNYDRDEEVRALSAGIADWPEVSEKVMTDLVSDSFRTVDNYKIFKAVTSHTDPWQALVGLDTFIDMLKSRNIFGGHAILEIAAGLKEITERANFSQAHLRRAQMAMYKIPECSRNLIIGPSFCILNKHYDAFLIATEYTDDSKRRRVWTSLRFDNTSTPKGAQWKFKRTSDKLNFESIDYANEFLYSVESGESTVHTPYVREVEDSDSGTSAWILHTYGDSCFLRNAATNKFLYASDNNAGSKQFNLVMSSGKLDDTVGPNSPLVWQIKSC